MTKRRPIDLLPSIHRTTALTKFFGSTVDQLFQPGRAEPVSGYIGRVPSYNDPISDFYKQEPTAERTSYQLEAGMASTIDGELSSMLFYDDLVSKLGSLGANTQDASRLFKSTYWAWSPPIDVDRINNFQQWYWSGLDVPALELTLPGMDVPLVYQGDGSQNTFLLPQVQECMNLLPEHATPKMANPTVLVNGARVSILSFTSSEVVLSAIPPEGSSIEIYRYGSVSDGLTTDYAVPTAFDNRPFAASDIHVYVNGREIVDYTLLDDNTRVRLGASAAINSIVMVTLHDSLAELCKGESQVDISKINQYGVAEFVNGHKVKFVDPSVFFTGFDVKPYDTFKWDEGADNLFYIEGVGTAIRLTSASRYGSVDPQYVVCSRTDPAFSYWSQVNRWVNGTALDWFGGKTHERQAKRPICEYVAGLRLFHYGITRAPEVDLVVGMTDTVTVNPLAITDDQGNTPQDGDLILFANVTNMDLQNRIFSWSEGVLTLIHTIMEGDTVQYGQIEYYLNGEWMEADPIGDFPLFDLYDNDGISLSDTGVYPDSDFSGSRIFCYEIGDGNADSVLGFPVTFDTYGQIMFENDLYTRRYSYRDGEMSGYYYYRVGEDFHNEWYATLGELPESVIPMNLQANPNFETPLRISRNNWFKHFASIVTNQDGFEGSPYTLNNWAMTPRDLSKGTEIIQSRAPLLKLMLLMSDHSFDLMKAIAFVNREYTRLKLKIAQQVSVNIRSGLMQHGNDPHAALIVILKKLSMNKTTDFAFHLSPIGGETLFIPLTPSIIGITPLVTPKVIEQYGDEYLVGHDGSKTLLSGDPLVDTVMLSFETMLFDYANRSTTPLGNIPLCDLVSGFWRTVDYSRDDFTSTLRASFEEWARNESIDYQINDTYDVENPFTWNYSGLLDRSGNVLPGNWRAIYEHYFDTQTPDITPWEMLGFVEQPLWWEARYGQHPYERSNTMWEDIRDGRIREGERVGIDLRFARPELFQYLPIDPQGNLTDPVVARIVDREPTQQIASANWVFGDGSPAETVWKRSSHYTFALMRAIFLMRPAQFVEYFWDTGNQILVHGNQWVDQTTNRRSPNSELIVHGETVDGVTKISTGIQNYLSEYLINLGQDPSIMGDLVRGLDVRLMHKMAGFTTPDRMTISAESFGLVPQEDITISLYRSPSVNLDVYSGVIVEYLSPYRWRVLGYNPTTPSFITRPGDPNGKRKNVIDIQNERIVNPWVTNVYYRVGMLVEFNHTVFSCIKPHVSSGQFETQFWEEDDVGHQPNDRIYEFTDWDGSYEVVPYATVMTSVQEVVSFLFAYARDLAARGFNFPEASWREAAEKFINWSSIDWATGAFITLSPAGRALGYTSQHGFIMDLNDPMGRNTIVNRTGHVIDHRNLVIDRFDNELSITASGEDDIYGAVLKKSSVEHALVFSNRTIFDDIIYDPVFNVRQDRLKLSARVTTDWVGRMDAPGFLISGNSIISNFEKSAEDIRYMFDIEKADNSVLRDHARHVIGFEKRDYLSNLLLNDTQQFELYQGMIQQKGALGSMDKIMRSKSVEGNRDVVFSEEWAFRLGEFGPNEPRVFQEIALTRPDIMRQNQMIHFGSARLPEWKANTPYSGGVMVIYNGVDYRANQTHVSSDIFDATKWVITSRDTASGVVNVKDDSERWISNPSDYTNLLTSERNNLPTAGYVRVDEATYLAPTWDVFSQQILNNIAMGKKVTAGESVWIYDRNIHGWSLDYISHPTDLSIGSLLPNWAMWTNAQAGRNSDTPDVLLSNHDIIDLRDSAIEYLTAVEDDTNYRFTIAAYIAETTTAPIVTFEWSTGVIETYTMDRSGNHSIDLLSPIGASTLLITITATSGVVVLGDCMLVYSGDPVRIIETIQGDDFNDIVGVRLVLDRPHNLAVDDHFIIDELALDIPDTAGVFTVTEIGSDWIEIIPEGEFINYDYVENNETGPAIYGFTPARFSTTTEAQSSDLKGRLVYVDNTTWTVVRHPDFSNPVREQPEYVDSSKIASALIYQKDTLVTDTSISPEALELAMINVIDPMAGIVSGIAAREIDYMLEYDPAGYDQDDLWTDAYIGRVWWDMSTTWFLDPYTDVLTDPIRANRELDYRVANWNRLAPNSSISLYEWTRSEISPELYDGVVRDQYVTIVEDGITVYYFWVLNPDVVPSVDFRKNDLKATAAILSNPSLAGLPWISPLSDKELLISGVSQYISDTTTVLQIQVQDTDMDEERPHVEWKLVRPQDDNTVPAPLWENLRDSLIEQDRNGNALPNIARNPYSRIGINQGQIMWNQQDGDLARQTFIASLNYMLATKQIDSSAFNPNVFTIAPTAPETLMWTKARDHDLGIPPSTMYQQVVHDSADLHEYLDNNSGIVLFDNRQGDNPSWSLWKKDGINVIPVSYAEIVPNRADLDVSGLHDEDWVLILEDEENNGQWSIINGALELLWTQPYNTEQSWEYSDWYSGEYTFDSEPVVTYATFTERNQKEFPVTNRLVKILDNGAGQWVWTAHINDAWVIVAQQDGVVQIKENANGLNLGALFDMLLAEHILTGREKNDLWFAMVNFVHSRNDQVDWAFKTSFMSILGFNEELLARPVTQPDNTQDIIRYIDEVKPYHVTIREFSRNFRASEETNVTVTDFDKPLYYDETIGQYRTLDLIRDAELLNTGKWAHWYNNQGLARRTVLSMKFDRIWFEDDGIDSGAAHRIANSPHSSDMDELLNLGFRGDIENGGAFGSPQDGELSDANGILSDFTEGYRLLDPRVAPNTPEEMVRLGAHDIFLLRSHDNALLGAPVMKAIHFDVSGETGLYTANLTVMVRNLILFGDGKRLSDFTYEQFPHTVTVDVTDISDLLVYQIGYAGETAIVEQKYLASVGGSQTIGMTSVVGNGVMVTQNGVTIASTVSGSDVTFTAPVGADIVITVYENQVLDTHIVEQNFPNAVNPVTSNSATSSSLGTMLANGPVIDPYTNRAYSYDTGLRIHNLTNGSATNHSVKFMDAFLNSDLIITQDQTTLSAGDHYRALQIRDASMTVIQTIGQTGIYSGAIDLTPDHIPASATVKALGNIINGDKIIMVGYQTKVLFFRASGEYIRGFDNFDWGDVSQLSMTSQLMSFLVVNQDRLDIVEVPNEGLINIKPVDITVLDQFGTMQIRNAIVVGYSVVLFTDRSEGGKAIIRLNLLDRSIEWIVWSNHMGQPDRFDFPQRVDTRMVDDLNIVWTVGSQVYLIDQLGVFDNFANSTATTGVQFWDEITNTLYVRESNTLRKYVIELINAKFSTIYQLPQYSNTHIIERNGERMIPQMMTHLHNVDEVMLDPQFGSVVVRDDTGVMVSAVRIPDVYETTQDIRQASLPHRFVQWRDRLVILDNDALSRQYTVMGAQNDYTISDTGLVTYRCRNGDVITSTHWVSDNLMDVQTYVYPTGSGTYPVYTRDDAIMVWDGNNILTFGVDYDLVNDRTGWGTDSFDSHTYDELIVTDVVLRDHQLGGSSTITIMVFGGVKARPARIWQHNTTTLSDRFVPLGDDLLLNHTAWATQVSDYRHEAILVSEIATTMTLDTITISVANIPYRLLTTIVQGAVWIGSERIEFLNHYQTGDEIILSQLHRGSQGTPITHHAIGDKVMFMRINS